MRSPCLGFLQALVTTVSAYPTAWLDMHRVQSASVEGGLLTTPSNVLIPKDKVIEVPLPPHTLNRSVETRSFLDSGENLARFPRLRKAHQDVSEDW